MSSRAPCSIRCPLRSGRRSWLKIAWVRAARSVPMSLRKRRRTALVHTSSHTAVTAATYAQLPYDTAKDFTAVIPLANLPNALIVAKAKGYQSARDMVEAAKAKPGSFNYASAGAGTASHFNAERFKLAAKFDARSRR